MDDIAPEPPDEIRGGSHRKDAGFNPVAMLRGFVQSSPWLIIAIAAHVVVLAVLAVWKLGHDVEKKDDAVVIQTSIRKEAPPEDTPEDKKEDLIDRSAIPENVEAELVSHEIENLPTDTSPRDLTQDIGDPNSTSDMPNSDPTGGTAIGVGVGGHHGTGTPSTFAGRKIGTGLRKGVLPGGPTQGTEEAIRIGLIWLVRHQNDNGSWSAMTCKDHCPADKPCQPETGAGEADAYTDKFDVGLTSISLLAFLGAGFGHNAKQYVVDTFKAKKSELGKDVVLKGLKWLVARQNPDGSFSSTGPQRSLYNEALAALALSEAYGLTANRAWKEPAQKAINFICAAQKDSPKGAGKWGWRYDAVADIQERVKDYKNDKDFQGELHDADTSVTGWMVMALKSAHASGLEVPKESEEGAINFVKWASRQDGLVGYLDAGAAGLPIQGEHDQQYKYHGPAMASVAMCVRVFLEQNIDDPYLKLSAEQIVKELPSVEGDPKDKTHSLIDYYYWYYGSLALNQLDGPDSPKRTNKYWGPWNKAMQESLLSLQSKEEKQCSTGGFLKPDRWSYSIGPIYTTAINILTLEVYYRYENAFGAAANRRLKKGSGPAKSDEPKSEPAGDKSNK
jgi:hypothetical protein